jgi:catechol 2,3-dioxygenase-like lactoylglutathione lyase family enzyme
MPVGPIAWNVIWAYDVPSMTEWYRDKLGLRVDYAAETATAFDAGSVLLVLLGRHDNGPATNPELKGWDRNQMVITFKVNDMEQTLAELASRGLEPEHIAPVVIDGESAPRWRVAQFMDPEGNMLELCDEPLRWHPGINA